ncbi:MAG: hypothetical protein R2712_30765 [Vicinamibacterales bacterium]
MDVDCAVGAVPCLTVDDDQGYEIDEAEVAYWGRCPECQARAAASSDVSAPPPRLAGAGANRRGPKVPHSA